MGLFPEKIICSLNKPMGLFLNFRNKTMGLFPIKNGNIKPLILRRQRMNLKQQPMNLKQHMRLKLKQHMRLKLNHLNYENISNNIPGKSNIHWYFIKVTKSRYSHKKTCSRISGKYLWLLFQINFISK
jgi:hypothetical protein